MDRIVNFASNERFFRLKNVIFHGRQENPYQFLKYADLFILSSRYEGFPNVLLEAGACGTYSLANNCPEELMKSFSIIPMEKLPILKIMKIFHKRL
jgi:glycosyltransferase involved in cell wall biosynthesis